mmetsp:Transcript_28078/g.74234  ORF Transcript_28078/g.74234 Transcript_28078/m.74234 type:complete len:113 (+) Transcript_28078:155-493(+)
MGGDNGGSDQVLHEKNLRASSSRVRTQSAPTVPTHKWVANTLHKLQETAEYFPHRFSVGCNGCLTQRGKRHGIHCQMGGRSFPVVPVKAVKDQTVPKKAVCTVCLVNKQASE